MSNRVLSAWRYTLGIVLAALAIALTREFPVLLQPMRLFFYWVAVISTALAAGMGPGVLALVICAGAYLAESGFPARALTAIEAARLALFVGSAIALAWIAGMRRRAHLEAGEVRQWLQHLVLTLSDGIVAADTAQRITLMNAAAERITGWRAPEAVGRGLSEVVTAFGAEVDLTRRDGTTILVESQLAPVGQQGFVAVLRDATARRVERESLRAVAEASSRLQRFTSALAGARTLEEVARIVTEQAGGAAGASAGILATVDGEHSRLEVLGVHGYSAEFLEKFPLPLNGPFPLCAAVRNNRPVFLASLTMAAAEYPQLLPVWQEEGSQAIVAVPLALEGRVIGACGWSFRAPQAFAAQEQDFFCAVAAQSAIAVDRIRLLESEHVARAEAERASRLRDEFLTVLSHELRTPITAIKGWVDLLQLDVGEDTMREGLAAISRSARAQLHLSNELLDIARAISGKLHLDRRPVDLRDVVTTVITLLTPNAADKGVALVAAGLDEPVRLEVDEARVQQVIWNLVANAIKFSDRGQIVTVTLRVAADVEIVVEDQGRGIAPEILPRIFDRFAQGEPSPGYSLGIGLAVVRHLVTAHGGRVLAHSDGEGRGARFTVVLPGSERRMAPQSQAS